MRTVVGYIHRHLAQGPPKGRQGASTLTLLPHELGSWPFEGLNSSQSVPSAQAFVSRSSASLEILLFAGAYWISETAFAAGRFVSSRPFGAWNYLYFSAETYTSLGLGDVYPTGSLRLLAGSETLTGLILIGWSTSFTFLVMTRFWRQNRRFRGHQSGKAA